MKVSIIIPTFNRAHYLGQTIDSALGQTYRDLEVIVSDNGSTDATAELCRAYVDDKRFSYFRNRTNIGLNPNFNILLHRYARGRYCYLLSDDDVLIDPRFVERAMGLVARHGVSLVFANYREVFVRNGREIARRDVTYSFPEVVDGSELFERWMTIHNGRRFYLVTQTAFFDRDLARSLGAFDERIVLSADIDAWFKMLAAGKKVGFVDSCVAAYRIHDGSVSVREAFSLDEWLDNFECYTNALPYAWENPRLADPERKVDWIIRQCFNDWPGGIVTVANVRQFWRALGRRPQLKAQFIRAMLSNPLLLLKLLLSVDDRTYAFVKKVYHTLFRREARLFWSARGIVKSGLRTDG